MRCSFSGRIRGEVLRSRAAACTCRPVRPFRPLPTTTKPLLVASSRAFCVGERERQKPPPAPDSESIFDLLVKSKGQNRPGLSKDAKRRPSDFMVWSHVFFVPPAVLAFQV